MGKARAPQAHVLRLAGSPGSLPACDPAAEPREPAGGRAAACTPGRDLDYVLVGPIVGAVVAAVRAWSLPGC